jgi:hypothetical protein
MARATKSRRSKAGVQPEAQYVIQLATAVAKFDDLRARLEKAGVRIDPSYRPINVNPALGNYVVRGWATPAARTRAAKIQGVSFFGDARISAV